MVVGVVGVVGVAAVVAAEAAAAAVTAVTAAVVAVAAEAAVAEAAAVVAAAAVAAAATEGENGLGPQASGLGRENETADEVAERRSSRLRDLRPLPHSSSCLQTASITFTRARCLSFASMMCHGALGVLVRSMRSPPAAM